MRKGLVLFILFAATLFAVDKTQVTVKTSSTSNGIVFVTILDAGKTFDLQCTQSAPFCTAPKVGTYWMVHLEKNHGLYDCDNVDLYAQDPGDDSSQKVGEYCVNQK